MKSLLKKVSLGVLTLGILAGCSSEEDTIVMAPLPSVSSQFEPEQLWETSVGDGVSHYFSRLAPTFAYDKIFVASRDGVVKALDPATGNELWQIDVVDGSQPRLSGGLTAAYSKVFVGSENGDVIALNEQTGEELWRTAIQAEVLSTPIADAGLILLNTGNGALVALDQETGESRWTISTEVPNLTLRGASTPVAASGGVFWGTASGRLAAAIVERGQLLWQQPVGTPKGATEIDRLIDVDAAPLLLGSTLYTIGFNGQLIAIDLRSGQASWKRNYSSATDMGTDGSRLFVVTDKDHLVAVDARSGTELWQNTALEYRQLTAPVVIDDYLVVADTLGYLHWLNRDTGEFVAQQLIDGSGIAVAPIRLSDGYLVVSRNGDVKKLTIKQ
ncbi:outer membrane protein assembly factor BamB [Vibrio sp. SM6]|uniref:Outer membrane protein assembly factor BamB n=1 Tax=Vibrio agarilyticus TaxID=2726741 RepID=A0A7X8YI30_9VIBR|nr:outer membrane protein assembly factor BamB [Vibrio agarilyticus]NLS14289.1 outer membrane protein assembly factor BamB [Vibrio agarilyticus]